MALLDLSGLIFLSSQLSNQKNSRSHKKIFASTSHSLNWWLLQKIWQFSIWKVFQSRFRATCLTLWSSCKHRNNGKRKTGVSSQAPLLKNKHLKKELKAWHRILESNWIFRRRVPMPLSCFKIENFHTISRISSRIQKLTTQQRIFGSFVLVSKSFTSNKVLYQLPVTFQTWPHTLISTWNCNKFTSKKLQTI